MKIKDIEGFLAQAVKNLFHNQPNLSAFTSETGQTEWNIAHHLANEINTLFPDYDCDLDVTKSSSDYRRPDIIIHKRGSHEDNLLVVEVKRHETSTSGERSDDIRKIKEDWFRKPLCYQFGAVVVMCRDKKTETKVFENSEHPEQ